MLIHTHFFFLFFVQCAAFAAWKAAKYLAIPQTPRGQVSIKRVANRWVA